MPGQILRGNSLAREVDVVDEHRDGHDQAEHQPLLLAEEDERRVQRDGVDDGEQQDLQQHPADGPGRGLGDLRRLALALVQWSRGLSEFCHLVPVVELPGRTRSAPAGMVLGVVT